MKSRLLVCLSIPLSLSVLPGLATAADSLTLTIKEHRFEPAELEVPAGQKFKLVVQNLDSSPEEFESDSLKREKMIPANGKISMNMGPLEPGTYEFIGEFHRSSAQGRLVAK